MTKLYFPETKKTLITSFLLKLKNLFNFSLVALMIFILANFSAQSQTASQYNFIASSGTYTPLVGGTPVTVSQTDDGTANNIPIPFAFNFCGNNYSSIGISTNGWVSFSGTANTTYTNSFTSTAVTYPILAPLWDDLQTLSLNNDISYAQRGNTFVIQYTGMRWNYLSTAGVGTISFQIILYNASLPSTDFGRIDFVYNQESGTLNSPSASIGIASASGNYLSLNNSSSAPTASNSVNTTNINDKPATGQVYTFTPPPPCNGAVTPGATLASVTSICAGSGGSSNLSIANTATGTTYQWYSSVNGGTTYSPISGATNATYAATGINTTTFFKCLVTCTNGGANAFSTPVQVIFDPTCIYMPLNSTSTVTNCSGTFYDRGGNTANYGNNERDTLTIFPSTPGSSVRVTFNSFRTESGWDGLLIYNGNNTAAPLFASGLAAGAAAPANSYYGTTSPGTITSTAADGSLTFVFNSDPSVTFAGWVATISCIAPCAGSPAPGLTLATSTVVCTGETTTLSLTNTNLGSGITYQWETSSNGVSWTQIAGATSPTYVATVTASAWYRCSVTCTNSGQTIPSGGVYVEGTNCTFINMPLNSSAVATTCAGHFYDTGGSTGQYTNSELDTLTIYPNSSDGKIRLIFNTFNTENNYDGMLIFNGNSTSAPLISSGLPASTVSPLTCPAGSFRGNGSPGTITSTAADGSLTIVFTSDDLVTAAGWDATITCYTPPVCAGQPFPGNTLATSTTVCVGASTLLSLQNVISGSGIEYQWQSSTNGTTWTDIVGANDAYLSTTITANTYFHCVIRCLNSAQSNVSSTLLITYDPTCIIMPASGSITTCNAGFYDSGGSLDAYGFNEDRTFTIRPAISGNFTRATFNSFSLEAGYDSLFIYDGLTTAAPLIGAYSAVSPGVVTASSANGALTFVFHSDFSNNNAGWDATISCYVPPLCNSQNTHLDTTLANPSVVCTGESSILSFSNTATLSGVTYQWYAGNSSTGPWSPIAGAVAPNYVATISQTKWYYCEAYCSASDFLASSLPAQVTAVVTPTVTSTTPRTRCGIGTVNLSATTSSGVLNWYNSANSGNLLFTGPTFTTPTINTTTTYYVGAVTTGTTESGGKISPAASSTGFVTTDWGIVFDATRNFILNSTVIYPVGTGTVTIALQSSSGIELATTNAIAVTGTGIATPVTIPLSFSVPAGSGYRLILKNYTGLTNIIRDNTSSTIFSFPYGSPSRSISVTSSWTGTSTTAAAYYWFYNLSITTGCESDRTAVTATVTTPPAIISTNPAGICPGGNATLSASSPNAGYTYVWTPGNFTGASYNVSPTTVGNNIYTVTATDNSGGANNGCVNIFSDTVVVNAIPTLPVVSPSTGNICAFQPQNISVLSGGLLPDGSFANISWSPITNLFRDLACTIPYTSGSVTSSVYFKPTAAGTFVYTAIATSAAGCTSTATSTLTVVDNQNTLTILNSPSTTVCTGTPITFTPTITTGSTTSSYIYSWYINNIATATAPSVGTTITVASTAQLAVGMKISVYSGTGAFTSNTTISSITNSTQFVVSIAPTTIIQAGAVIAGNVVNTNFGSPTWTPTNLINGNQIQCIFTGNLYTCTYNSSGVVTNPAKSNIITMSLNPSTPTSVALSTPLTTVCATVPVTFTATTTNAGAAATYQFFVNGSSAQGPGSSNTFTTSSLANGAIVKVKMVSNATNCPNPNPAYDSLTMTVNPSFRVSDTLTANPGINVCIGSTITFTATPTFGGTAPTYKFVKNGAVVQNTTSNQYVATNVANNDVFYCVMTSDLVGTCVLNNPDTSNIMTVIAQQQNDTIRLSSNPAAPCAGSSVTYTAQVGPIGSNPSYQFYVNGSPVANSGNTYTYTPTNGDSISVIVNPDLSCAVTNPISAGIRQTLLASPTASVFNSGLTCIFGSATLDAGASAGSGTISSYQWFYSTNSGTTYNSFPGGIGPSIYTTTNGLYYVVVNNSAGCSFSTASSPFSLTVPGAPTPMVGNYTVGAITATNVTSSGNVFTCASTANLVVGALLKKTSNTTGAFATNTVISSIIDGTRFTVNINPTTAFSVAGTIAGATCTNYVSVDAANKDLNLRGISGTCIFDIPANYVEYDTGRINLGGSTLNPTVTSGRTIVFRKNPNTSGANPTLYAYVGRQSGSGVTEPDGMWALNGVDSVTIDGINLVDTNTVSSTTMMEYGIGMFRASATDGAQRNTIKNCKITLNRNNNAAAAGAAMPEGSVGILVANTNCTNASNIYTTTGGVGGANSYNRFYSDSVVNTNHGIALMGYAAASGGTSPVDGDFGNDVGGSSTATGNTIINFGGATAATNQSNGIRANNQWGCNISYNKINNNYGAGANHPSILRGIYGQAGTSANVSILSNIVTISGGGNANCSGIENSIGSTAASNVVNISNNSVTGGNTSATSASFFAIANTAICDSLIMNGNTVQNITYASSGEFRGIWNSGSATGALSMNNNTISGIAITSTTAATFNNLGTVNISRNASISNNTIQGNSKVFGGAASPSTVHWINFSAASTTCNTSISNNTIIEDTVKYTSGTGTLTTAAINFANTIPTADNNFIRNLGANINVAGAGIVTVIGVNDVSAGAVNISRNTIRRLFISGSTASSVANLVYGIQSNVISSTATKNIYNNNIDSLYTASNVQSSINGIRNGNGANVNIYKNKIHSFIAGQSANLNVSYVRGIYLTAGGGVGAIANVYNNMIAFDQSDSLGIAVTRKNILNNVDAVRGIAIEHVQASNNVNVYYNTVRIAGTGTGNFGSTAIYHTANASSTSARLDLRNNIIDNESTPAGTGLVVALRRQLATLANDSTISNYNLFYAGTPSASRLLYYDGASSVQTITALKTLLTPRESSSRTGQPAFVSAIDLHLQSCNQTVRDSIDTKASVISITTDFDDQNRDGSTPDIGADEVNNSSFGGAVSSNASVCPGNNSGTLTLSGYSIGGSGNIVKWQISTDSTFWRDTVISTSTIGYLNLTVKTWFRAVVYNSDCNVNSNSIPAAISMNATPTITGTMKVCRNATSQLTGSGNAATNVWAVTTNPSVASITATGLVTALLPGSATIRLTNSSGCFKDTLFRVNALPVITGLTSVCVGATIQHTADSAAALSNPWVSIATSIATISGSSTTGTVLGVSAGIDSIKYTDINGCIAYIKDTINANPTTLSLSPSSASICIGGSLTITGPPTPNALTPWTSLTPSVATINGGGVVSPVAAGQTIIRYKNSNGCYRDTTITVNAKPTISASSGGASISSITLCAGDTSRVYGTASSPLSNAWTTTSGGIASVSSTTGTNTLITGVSGGGCSITYTNTNGCTQTISVTINALPTRYNLTGGGTVCANAPVVGLSNSQSGVNYQLIRVPAVNVGSPVAGTGSPISFGTIATNGVYYVKATNATSLCFKNMLDSVTVRVNANPVINGATALCGGTNTQLTADSTAAASNAWTSSNTLVASVSSTGYVTGLTIGSTDIVYTDQNGCKDTTTVTISQPTVAGTIASGAIVCSGSNGATITLSGNTGNVVRWLSSTDGGVTWSSIVNTTTTLTYLNLTQTTKYRALVQNGAGCTADSTNIVTITVNPNPTVFTVTGGGSFCEGGSGIVIGLNGSTSGITYQLIRNGITVVSTRAGTNSAITFANQTVAGTYTVVANNAGTGCSAAMLGSATVTVTPKPTADIIQTGPIVLCAGSSQTLTSTTNAATPTYQWYLDGTAISGATTASYNVSVLGTGVYSLLVTNGSCSGLKTKGVVVTITNKPSSVSISPDTSTICLGGSALLTAGSDSIIGPDVALYENFNDTAHISFTVSNASTSPATGNWRLNSVPFTKTTGTPTFTNFSTTDGGWFARADADAGGIGVETDLRSPVFSLANYQDANLTFEHSLHSDAFYDYYVEVDISTDGGATWNVLKDYLDSTRGNVSSGTQTTVSENIDLSAYVGQSNLKISFYYVSDFGYYWIVDNVKIAGIKKYPTTYTWSPNTNLNTTTGSQVLASPPSTLSYYLTATSTVGCSNKDTAVVKVNTIPVITTEPVGASICSGGTLSNLSVTATGSIQTYQWYIHLPNRDSLLVGANNSTYLPNSNLDTTRYFVIVDGPCGSDTSRTVAVVVGSGSSSAIISGTATIPTGNSTNLVVNITGGASPYTLVYSNGTTNTTITGYVSGTNISVSPLTTTTYTIVSVTSAAGCVGTGNSGSAIVTVGCGNIGALAAGTYYIPGTCYNFPSIDSATKYVNTNGVAGNVIFLVDSNYVETAPSGGIKLGSAALNSSANATSSSKTITFRKRGTGANPKIRAYIGGTATPASAAPDGIWSLRGADYITIDGIDLSDSSLNSNNALMEYGYGLFKASPTDGAQHNVIKNCTITLNKNNVTAQATSTAFFDGSVGIAVVNDTATTVNTGIIPTSDLGTNSFNKFSANTIQNCNIGIGLNGYATTTLYSDSSNVIGDSTLAANGNRIINFGGGTGAPINSYGIYAKNQFGTTIGYNTINNHLDNNGVDHTNNQTAIKTDNATGTTSVTIVGNNIAISGGGDKTYFGIDNTSGYGSSSIINILNNSMIVTIPSSISTTSGFGAVTGIKNSGASPTTTINISGNTLKRSGISGTGVWTGIYNTLNAGSIGNITMNNNTIDSNSIASTGTFYGLQNDGNYSSLTMSGNVITNNSKTSIAAELSWLKQNAANGSLTIQNNYLEKDTVIVASTNATSLSVYAVRLAGTNVASSTINFSGNTIKKQYIKDINSTFTATLRGYYNLIPTGQTPTENIYNNKISNLYISAAAGSGTGVTHAIYGIQTGSSVTASNNIRNIYNNKVDSFYVRKNADATPAYNSIIVGIHNNIGGNNISIYKNKISHLIPYGTGAGSFAKGIWIGGTLGGTTPKVNIYNNMINMDLSQAFDGAVSGVLTATEALKGIDIAQSTADTTFLYYNTIRIAGNGGAGFGSSGVSFATATANVVARLKNNILVNKSVPGAGGIVAALRRASTANNYDTASSNNVFYVDTTVAGSNMYYEVSTGFNSINGGWATSNRERNSYTIVEPSFVKAPDLTDSLHLNSLTNCVMDAYGTPIATITDDIDGDNRVNPTDIGADEFSTTGTSGEWAGINTNWNDPANWCGIRPTSSSNITIPSGKPNYPSIGAATLPVPVCNNLTVNNGGSINMTNGGKMKIYGTLSTVTGGIFNARQGTIELAGSTPQSIGANIFQNNNLKNLIINNSSVLLTGNLNLLGKLAFSGSSRTLNIGNGLLAMKSSDSATAYLGNITKDANTGALVNGNVVTGDAVLERYISSRKAWRLLAMPTKHNAQTIKQAWQEGAADSLGNANPGYGFQITSNINSPVNAWVGLGFDGYSPSGPSVKVYNTATNLYDGIPSTNINFTSGKAYMTFIRGDRSIRTLTQSPTSTVLREKGGFEQGNITYSNLSTASGQFISISNPYASAIKFDSLGRTAINNLYYLWDPKLSSYGGFQSFQYVLGAWQCAACVLGSSYNVPASSYAIQSGQGFFTTASAANASLTFTENSKVDTNYLVARNPEQISSLRTILYRVQNGNASLYDGVMNIFDSTLSNEVDANDAVKLGGFNENLAINKNSQLISIEAHANLTSNDTIFYKLGQVKITNYRFEFMPSNINQTNLLAFLEDSYLNTSTPVSLTDNTTYDFAVSSAAGSYNPDRFRLVFKPLAPVSVTFVDVKAEKQNKDVLVSWKVENEINIHHYVVEKSADGRSFTQVGTVNASSVANYSWLDNQALSGNNFYRIRSVELNGSMQISRVVKVVFDIKPAVSIYPNPVKEDRLVNINFENMAEGLYKIRLINDIGQVVQTKSILHGGGNALYQMVLNKKLAHGQFILEINSPANSKTNIKMLY